MNQAALDFIIKHEGGYVNDPDDSGGATNFGIIQSTYDDYRAAWGLGIRSVKLIERSEVERIYESYWRACGADYIDNFCNNYPLALLVFDCAVNCGIGRTKKMLQECLGLTPDGVIGPKTKEALFKSGPNLITYFAAVRLDYYLDIVLRKSSQLKFLPSWIRRVQHCLQA